MPPNSERATAARGQSGDRLEAAGIRVHFDGLKALDGIDLSLGRGEILGLIGPNGAGKTTLVNVLSGFQRPTGGRVLLGETDVTAWSPQRRARRGIVRTFQSVRPFSDLTVFENVELGAVGAGIGRRDARRLADTLLRRLGLASRRESPAASLPHGDERRLGIARALASRPRFVLFDEPAAGLNDAESGELVEILRGLPADFACGVLVIEHEMAVIMNVSERIQVLDYGKTIGVGTPAEVRANPAVLAAYLGTKEATGAGGR